MFQELHFFFASFFNFTMSFGVTVSLRRPTSRHFDFLVFKFTSCFQAFWEGPAPPLGTSAFLFQKISTPLVYFPGAGGVTPGNPGASEPYLSALSRFSFFRCSKTHRVFTLSWGNPAHLSALPRSVFRKSQRLSSTFLGLVG